MVSSAYATAIADACAIATAAAYALAIANACAVAFALVLMKGETQCL